GVEIEVAFLAVLAMIAFRAGQTKQALLEDRILAVPQRQGKAQAALPVADPQQAVLAPAVGAAAGVVVGQVAPGRSVRRVVFAHGAPLALGQVRPPALPIRGAGTVLVQAPRLGITDILPVTQRLWLCRHVRTRGALFVVLSLWLSHSRNPPRK